MHQIVLTELLILNILNTILHTKTTAPQNEAALGHQSARAIFSGSHFCGNYILSQFLYESLTKVSKDEIYRM